MLRWTCHILALWLLAGCTLVPMNDRIIAVAGAPAAAGPYSQGVVANGFLFTAGFTPRDPATNKQVEGDIKAKATRVFDSIEAVLKGASCSFANVVKVTVYMTNLDDFSKMNEVMAARFGDNKPARTTIQAARLPGGAALEIDVVAKLP